MSMRANLHNADNRAFMSSIVNPEEMDTRVRQSMCVAIAREVIRQIDSDNVQPAHPDVRFWDTDGGKKHIELDEKKSQSLAGVEHTRFFGFNIPAGFDGELEDGKRILMWATRTSVYKRFPVGMRSIFPFLKHDEVIMYSAASDFSKDAKSETAVVESASRPYFKLKRTPEESMLTFVQSMSLVTRALGIDQDLEERHYVLPAKLLTEPAAS